MAARGVGPAATCMTCHNSRITFSALTQDGFLEGLQTEVAGSIRILKGFLAGTSDPVCDPAIDNLKPQSCYAFAAGASPQALAAEQTLVSAAWNATLIANDRSRGIHNGAFAVAVLQRSYQALAGVPVPNGTLR